MVISVKELWEDIKGYEGLYQVSNLGRVKSLNYNHTNRERILKQRFCGKNKNYLSVALYRDNKRKDHRVHRLVALTFLGHSPLTVNHKNEITTDNGICNLEYLTNKDNMRYSRCKRINQYTIHGVFVKTWDSIADAQTELHISHISDVARNIRKSAGGFIWRYEGE